MKAITTLALTAAAAAMPVALLAAPAQAAPVDGASTDRHASCGTNGPNLDSRNSSGAASGARLRTGSDTGCTGRGSSQPADGLDYYCYTVGNDGMTWTFLRNTRTGVVGWTRDDLLSDGGSTVHCGF
ncbi:SH3 domain-containing protein [Saccharothrix longispora]|uniref:SH3 domain-containing protein n=1 Tax=Saccharothrix longispora TaxID=33920 RepID=UPI0028FD31AA|nr:SH3 domain-containing protein [Saccharothrix longispora]MBY8849304.1 SH3 domain-containing protein [Saccharothrix sp. MB29]MDU0288935.1 SH3 domain-containing protein [Saccharothrix longispora]